MSPRAVLSSAFLLALGFACGQVTAPLPSGSATAKAEAETPIPDDLSTEEKRDIEVFRRASASVVFITSETFQRDFFSLDVYAIPQGSGSGFVWDDKGHVVTNFHVIEGADRLKITLADQSEWDAKVVGTAPDKDLAVLEIGARASGLVPLALGKSHDLLVGQRVLALGNPFGLDHSLTVGVVSALGREIQAPNGRTIRDVIQTDAAINPGNSGGPLLDSRGRLIGVNAQILSPSRASAGIGFAVPVDTVAKLVPQLIQHGKPIVPGIGIVLIPDPIAARYRIVGAAIAEVSDGSPAERAGLEGVTVIRSRGWRLRDVIVAVDGKQVSNGDELAYAFETAGIGADVTLTVERDTSKRDVSVRLVAVR